MDHTVTVTVHSETFLLSGQGPAACQLIVVDGPDMGKAINIADEEVIVGSGQECDLRLRDERVSRAHLGVKSMEDGRFTIEDKQSRNGTMYEGSSIGRAIVPAGATLKVGHTFLRIQPRPQPVEVSPSQSQRFGQLVAQSLSMREVFAIMALVSPTDATVLIEGETGTGKELTARAIHEHSARSQRPFVVVDCGALPESLLDSELFGHVKGAFTGALNARAGAFARADGGTIFLDELDSISLDAQARLLRALEMRQVRPLGADEERAVDVRVIAACGRDLEHLVAEGKFRPDLFYRLSVVRLRLPALRERREDIPLIVRELMRLRGMDAGDVDGGNMHRLMAHGWPGNVRELRNVIERAIALSPGAQTFEDLRLNVRPGQSAPAMNVRTDLPFAQAKQTLIDEFERRYLRDLYERCDGNISQAAREAEVDRKHLRHLLRRHEIIT